MKKIHLIGNSHLDPVWLWRWQEGFAEIKATFRSALDRMKEFDDFKFTSACASYYEWIEKSDPEMFREIQDRVREGRWNIVGGWYLQPDCNLPSGESFARHALFSQRYFKDKFGKKCVTGYNVDSFGHNGNLPKILANSGMKNYVFMRPMPHEKELPESLFDWESSDGSKVRTYRIPQFYNIDMRRPEVFSQIEEMPEKYEMMAFYGVGNHGGGATIRQLDWMHKNLGENYVYSTVDAYFDAVKNEEVSIISEELQYHAKGCYSVCSAIKKANRKCENALVNLEKYSVLSEQLIKTEYPAKELERAWKNVMFNQFHDILDGCCIEEAYIDAEYLHGEAMSIAERGTNFALQQISWNIDTMGDMELVPYKSNSVLGAGWRCEDKIGTPVVIFNPLEREVTAVVTTTAMPSSMRDDEGREIPIQRVRAPRTNGEEDKTEFAFSVKVPALGYTTYRLYFETEAGAVENPFICSNTAIENEFIKLTFNPMSGELSSFFDKSARKELLSGDTGTVLVDEEHCDTWAHEVEEFRDVSELCKKGSVHLIEAGPVRAAIRSVQEIGNSSVIRDYYISAQSKEVRVKTKIDFREKHKMLKFSIPANTKNPTVLGEIPFGFAKRENDGKENFCHSWISINDENCGIGVANDSKYSFDAFQNTLSLTILRGAIYADHYGQKARDEFCEYMEQGVHKFEYSLFPFESISETKHRADALNNRPVVIVETFHKGSLAEKFSGIEVSEPNVIVTAIKKRADNNGIVIRLLETENRDTDVNINLLGTEFTAHLGKNEVKTFIVDNGIVTETDFVEG